MRSLGKLGGHGETHSQGPRLGSFRTQSTPRSDDVVLWINRGIPMAAPVKQVSASVLEKSIQFRTLSRPLPCRTPQIELHEYYIYTSVHLSLRHLSTTSI